jgi:energy-coupling factor transporter ATP-binding protein EcfA2
VYVAKVKLENVRGFHDARRVDLDLTRTDHDSYAGWTVLVGHNGSGKTTLLRAIALALAGPEACRTLTGDAASWVSAGHERGGVELDLAGGRYVGLTLSSDGVEVESNIERADFLCIGYGPHRRLGGGTALTQTGALARLAGLFREDLSLSESVTWLIGQHQRAQEKRPGAAEVRAAVLAVVNDGLLPGVADPADLQVAIREMGEGDRTMAAMVIDLLRHMHQAYGRLTLHPEHPAVTAPGVVLIDEIDAHMHPEWQQRVGGWLKWHFPAVQFLVSTNSPLVCQAADPRGLIRLPAPDELRAPYVVEDDLYRRVVFGSAEDVLLSDLFGLDSPYSPQARLLRQELVELELKVLDGRASEIQLARYRELQELLVSSPAARALEIEARLVREKARRGSR